MRTQRLMIPYRLAAAFALLASAALGQAQAQVQAPPAASTSAPAAKAAIHAKSAATTRPPLDLHAPPLNHIYPSAELRYILAVDDPTVDEDTTEVSVKGTKYAVRVPGVPGNQLQAIPWAIVHPTQAWRIFTPLVEP
jgi:hypothetical protein